jgi:hypothetical protein
MQRGTQGISVASQPALDRVEVGRSESDGRFRPQAFRPHTMPDEWRRWKERDCHQSDSLPVRTQFERQNMSVRLRTIKSIRPKTRPMSSAHMQSCAE